jgi:hypothetical protein
MSFKSLAALGLAAASIAFATAPASANVGNQATELNLATTAGGTAGVEPAMGRCTCYRVVRYRYYRPVRYYRVRYVVRVRYYY